MTILTHGVERPKFLDADRGGQLSFDAPLTPRRRRCAPTGRGTSVDRRLRAPAALRADLAPDDVADLALALAAGRVAPATTPESHPTSLTIDPRSGGGLTLDELLVGAWEGITAHRTVSCPVCSGAMAPRAAAGPGSVTAGACQGCGTVLR